MGARLTSRLLTFARRRQFAPALIDLNEQVMGMVDLLRRTIGEHIDLNARLAPRLWQVRADPSEVENAILNLAINARDAMSRGGRLVIATENVEVGAAEAGTLSQLQPGGYVSLSVADTGQGMTPDILSRAIEPFFTTKEPGKGTGLGLSTIYGFAQQSGGTVTISSEPGQGTTVHLYLPRVTEAEAAADRDVGPQSSVPAARGETILLVEDNLEVREVTRQRLVDIGYRVIEAENGAAALVLLARPDRPPIDLVFSDVVMSGGVSGFDLADRLKEKWPDIKIVLSSGFADGALRSRQDDRMSVPLLAKPYSRADLARVLRASLDG